MPPRAPAPHPALPVGTLLLIPSREQVQPWQSKQAPQASINPTTGCAKTGESAEVDPISSPQNTPGYLHHDGPTPLVKLCQKAFAQMVKAFRQSKHMWAGVRMRSPCTQMKSRFQWSVQICPVALQELWPHRISHCFCMTKQCFSAVNH